MEFPVVEEPDQTPSYRLNSAPKWISHLQVIQVLGLDLPRVKKESQLTVSHQAAAGHRTTDEETDLTVNGHGTKMDPQKENKNRILVKITMKEYEGYREIIRIAKKHGEVEKIKINEEEETSNPKQTIYIKYK